MITLPLDSSTLIEELDKMFPNKCIGKGETAEEAHRYAGRRELIDELKELKRQTEEDDQTTS
ncbi:hypothetical protein [Roseibium alexandrii]|uniref:Uncharacterized protein n=1 Tax=Roseibium alexandrii (strain DSM 17067 / NCIMB 14079 / DFL-11) TaxID=244592 RepID=A0A5E8GWH0_ROSAD|nr:hypothetical protein [Roseibium alexandrii]EEE43296.1 hypothetical protein SADFL11_582 [Roseibium alexandrii DFL-11]